MQFQFEFLILQQGSQQDTVLDFMEGRLYTGGGWGGGGIGMEYQYFSVGMAYTLQQIMQSTVLGKISAQPHTILYIQFLDRENNNKNNTLPLRKQICFTIVWGCAEILPSPIVFGRKRIKGLECEVIPKSLVIWVSLVIQDYDVHGGYRGISLTL